MRSVALPVVVVFDLIDGSSVSPNDDSMTRSVSPGARVGALKRLRTDGEPAKWLANDAAIAPITKKVATTDEAAGRGKLRAGTGLSKLLDAPVRMQSSAEPAPRIGGNRAARRG